MIRYNGTFYIADEEENKLQKKIKDSVNDDVNRYLEMCPNEKLLLKEWKTKEEKSGIRKTFLCICSDKTNHSGITRYSKSYIILKPNKIEGE